MRNITLPVLGIGLLLVSQSVFAGTNTIERGDTVNYEYTLRAGGTIVETTDYDLAEKYDIYGTYKPTITIGSGTTPLEKTIERALVGMRVGDEQTIRVDATNGYTTGSLQETVQLMEVMRDSWLDITKEEATPSREDEYSLDSFSPLVQKRIALGKRIASPYDSQRWGVVTKIDGDTVTLSFPDESHPFYGKKVAVGLKVRKHGMVYSVSAMRPDGSLRLRVYNPYVSLTETPQVGQILDEYIVTEVSDTTFSRIPVDNNIGKDLQVTLMPVGFDRTIRENNSVTHISSYIRDTNEDE